MNLITIYIPTFKSPKCLRKQLSALKTFKKSTNNIRVIVSDNASPLNKSLEIEFPEFSFRRNAINVGGNANIANGFISPFLSNYLWILSDNDFLDGSYLKNLEKYLTNNDPDFIIFDRDSVKPRYDIVKKNDMKFIWKKGLISDCIYKVNNFKDFGVIPFLYHNSSFPHLAMAIKILTTKSESKYTILPKEKYFKSKEITKRYNVEATSDGDYSISQNGMPLLIELMPEKFGRKFALGWFLKHGYRTIDISPEYLGISLNTIRTKSYSMLKGKLGLLFYPIWLFSVLKYFTWRIYRILKK